jgi:hypothetical protein
VRDRAVRLLWPATVYVVLVVLAAAAARAAGVRAVEITEAGWLLAAHRRWGLIVPMAMAAGAAVVDAAVLGRRLHVVGYAS